MTGMTRFCSRAREATLSAIARNAARVEVEVGMKGLPRDADSVNEG
jgi:hypothetical protein